MAKTHHPSSTEAPAQTRTEILKDLRQKTSTRRQEDMELTPGYFGLMIDRAPFVALEECHNDASAFVWGLEQIAYETPQELTFNELAREIIPEDELSRIYKASLAVGQKMAN